MLLALSGGTFIALWLVLSLVWFALSMMGGLMANDAGHASADRHVALIGGVLAGQVGTTLAGVFGGMAFFYRSRRRRMVLLFLVLLVAGVLAQLLSFQAFFAAPSGGTAGASAVIRPF